MSSCVQPVTIEITAECPHFNNLLWAHPAASTTGGAIWTMFPDGLTGSSGILSMIIFGPGDSVTVSNTAALNWGGGLCHCNLRIDWDNSTGAPNNGGVNFVIDGGSGGGLVCGLGTANPPGVYNFPFIVDNGGVPYTIQVTINGSLTDFLGAGVRVASSLFAFTNV